MKTHHSSDRRIVHFHPPVGLSALFRPLPKVGTSGRPPLDVTYRAATGGPTLRFSAKSALGIPEQTLLLVILELAKEQFSERANEMVVDSAAEDGVARELWSRLNKSGADVKGRTLRLETTWYELNMRCGTDTGGSARHMRESQLERLCEVVVWEHDSDISSTKRQSYLVVWLTGDDKRIHLAVNAKLASALLGMPYAQVSLTERLALGKDIARALHTFLSVTIPYGRHLKFKVETLIERLWPGSFDTALRGTHRKRRKDVRDGLNEIGRLKGWEVEWAREDLAEVRRCSLGVTNMTSHIGNKGADYQKRALPIIPNKIKELHSFDVSGLFFNKNASA